MKKLMALCAAMCVLSVPCYAGLGVNSILIDNLETNGFTASYNHLTEQITWSGGASISFYNGSGNSPVLTLSDGVNLRATFSGMIDSSSGSVASASFSVVGWDLSYYGVTLLSGAQLGSEMYSEQEEAGLGGGTGTLNGAGVVQVTGGSLTATNGWGHGGGNFSWLDSLYDGAKLKSTIIVDERFNDYDTDDYSSILSTMWLYADETIVPEPTTLILLGLGSFVMLRKRKA